jgi:uncharacterized membrane protein YeaQ/YmgE (transglycosylase-associated protein family)
MDLNPGGLLGWIVVGLVAGWLTGRLMSGRGYGCFGNLVLGLIGAIVGGFLTSFFLRGAAGLLGSIIIATLGAILFVAATRLVFGRGRP